MSKTVGDYVITRKLGSGSFASVFKAHHTRYPDKVVAIKSISASKLNKKLQENLTTEIGILRKIAHVNVVRLYGIQKSDRHIYLLMEYCDGGDLHRFIKKSPSGKLSIETSRHFMRQLGVGMKYLWSKSLIHRDLKPQNLLLSSDGAGGTGQWQLKIADFGFARHLAVAAMAETLCGSPLYMAPEILKFHKYDAKADLWSAGTILFEMLTGRPPFHGANPQELLRNIEKTELLFPQGISINTDCRDLIQQLLRKDPIERVSFEEFFRSKFLKLDVLNSDYEGGDLETYVGVNAIAQFTNVETTREDKDGGGGFSSATFSSNSESSGVMNMLSIPSADTNSVKGSGNRAGSGSAKNFSKGSNSRPKKNNAEVDIDEAWEFVSTEAVNIRVKEKGHKGAEEKGKRLNSGSRVRSHSDRPSSTNKSSSKKPDEMHILRYAEKLGDKAHLLGKFAFRVEGRHADFADLYKILVPFLEELHISFSSEDHNKLSTFEDDCGKKTLIIMLLTKSISILEIAIQTAHSVKSAGGQVREAAEVICSEFRNYVEQFDLAIRQLLQQQSGMVPNVYGKSEALVLALGLALGRVAAGQEAVLVNNSNSIQISDTDSCVGVSLEHCEELYRSGMLMFEILAAEPEISVADLKTVRGYLSMYIARLNKIKSLA